MPRVPPFFEAIYLLDKDGEVLNAGLPRSREHYRKDLLGIQLGHKKEFRKTLKTGLPQWSNTFLSLSSGKISLTLYTPSEKKVLAADINLNSLAKLISRLSISNVITMVIDNNGAILFHPDSDLVGRSVMVNDIDLVSEALQGNEKTGEFEFRGKNYLGSASTIKPAGWVSLIAEPREQQNRQLLVPLLIFAGGIGGAVVLSFLLAVLRTSSLAKPLTEITTKSSVIAQGDYTTPLPQSDFTELEQLAGSIDIMAKSIQQRETALLINEQKYRELVENTSNLVLRLNSDLQIIYANHTIENLTGKSVSEVHECRIANFLTEEEWQNMEKRINGWLSDGTTNANHEISICHKDGSFQNLLLSINLHYAETGNLNDIYIIGHDITARYEIERQQKEMERQSQQTQKMELLGLMAGGVAHDLNNILAGIVNYPELILLQMAEDDPRRPLVSSIKKSGERASAVVADLLTVARHSASIHQACDLNELIVECCDSPEFQKLQQQYPNIQLKFQPDHTLSPCLCSKSHIEKTILNLVINGFEAIGKEGQVEIQTKKMILDEPAAEDLQFTAGVYSTVIVKDDGEGIARQELEKIFEPFFSRKQLGRSGTGLGLTVAWSSVKEHGGTIDVVSDQGGTTFTIYLPATEAEYVTSSKESTDIEQYHGNGEQILVVDDEEHLCEIAVNMLEILKYRPVAVSSGEEALLYLDKHTVDLVVLDMLMEPGMNGRQTYEKILTINPQQKAVIASGFSESVDVEAVLTMGAGAFIRKPYSLYDLGHSIAEVLGDSPETMEGSE